MVKHCWKRQEDASDLAGRHELGEHISRHWLVFDGFIYNSMPSIIRMSLGMASAEFFWCAMSKSQNA